MYLSFKRGDTVEISATDNAGDLTGAQIEASVEARGFSQSLTVTDVDLSAGKYTLSATPEETENWPVGALSCDLKYTVGNAVVHSPTFQIVIKERVTA